VTPLIGITAYAEQARWGVWDTAVTLLPQRYVDAVHAAGGRAVVIPPSPTGSDALVAALDGLLLAGGADLDPALYGAARDPHTDGIRPDRDAGEVALLNAAVEADVPVLGICRGMQLMSAVAGGTLVQHLPDAVGSDRHRGGPGQYVQHSIGTVPGTRLAELLGESAVVPSYHHQGVAEAGSLTVSAHAEDGTIEAVERPGARFAIGVLWHPEVGADSRLFTALVTAAGLGR
jgi:putative glutamine amidotransferase